MSIHDLYDKWKEFTRRMNEKGVPLPTIRDPKTGSGSVSLTLLVFASIWVQIGLLGKFSRVFEGVNLDQALQFFYACSALYFGRRWTSKDGSKLDLEDSSNSEEKS